MAGGAGVTQDMSLPLAKALIPNALVFKFYPIREANALYLLALQMIKISPVVNLDNAWTQATSRAVFPISKLSFIPDPIYNGLILDLSGTERIYKNQNELLQKVIARFNELKISAKLAIAPSIGAAWALSRFHNDSLCVVERKDQIKSHILPLPLEALRIEEKTGQELISVGVKQIGDLLSLSRKSLYIRYGADLVKRMDEVLGANIEAISSIKTPLCSEEEKDFLSPLQSLESVVKSCGELLVDVAEKLRKQNKKASSFLITLKGVDEKESNKKFNIEKEFFFYRSSSNISHLISILTYSLEKIRLKGPVQYIKVKASSIESDLNRQDSFIEKNNDLIERNKSELLDILSSKLGQQAVNQITLKASYIPEKSFAFVPFRAKKNQSLARAGNVPFALRPSCLFSRPQRIFALSLLPDRPPSLITWNNQNYRIVKGSGPERISAEWWSFEAREESDRDYFKIQDHQGRWLWVFRRKDSLEWFLQGIWA
jgi:protein ImuB